ncbi:hypothetical protein Bca101_032391 [Brassica carinata]
MAMKRNGKSPVSSDSDEKVVFFNDVSLGPHASQLRFRLIHFWEARNPVKKTLIGMEMLLIDEHGTVVQGFIPPGPIKKYLPDMKPLHDIPLHFDEDSFRFHSYEDFEANCDLRGDLYDVVGHMKLVNGQTLTERFILDELEVATTRHVLVHVQSHDGPMMKLYFWDQAATEFCTKFKTFENTPTVILVTTVNPKRLRGTFALTSMSSTRVFMDYDVQPTIEYFTWYVPLSSASILSQIVVKRTLTSIAVSAEVVTKRETLSIADIFSYIKQDSAKCTATIDDVVHGSAWYRAKISIYDNSEQAVFVLLGDAGRSLTGKQASELLSSYFEANGDKGAEDEVPVPEALISIIGQTHRFCVKVTDHNFSGNTRAITVTKVLSQDIPPHTEASVGDNNAATSKEIVLTGDEVYEPSKSHGYCANEESKRGYDTADPEKAKRPRCEN